MEINGAMLKQKRRERNLSLEYIAKYLDISKSTLSRMERGEIKKISEERLQKLGEVLEVECDLLLNMDTSNCMKPILGVVKAGYDMFAYENILGYEEVTKAEGTRGDFFLRVQGDSMVNFRIYDGDLVFVKACDDVDSGSIAIVLISGDEATVKRVVKKQDMLILEAGNPLYENRYFTKEEVEELPVRIRGKVLFTKVAFH